jgi:hypothetical protein
MLLLRDISPWIVGSVAGGVVGVVAMRSQLSQGGEVVNPLGFFIFSALLGIGGAWISVGVMSLF